MSFTFIHFNIANLPCLAALDVVETHYKGPFFLQMHNAAISIIKYTCDIISSENDYILRKDFFSIYKNEFNKKLLEKERLNNCFF